jgi:hypothetical protein
VTLDREWIRRYREDAMADLERRANWAANGRTLTPSQQQHRLMLDPRDGAIVNLADALLDLLDEAKGEDA